ncbi:MAG: hypothetical protein KJ721_02740, partial [Nanoarchaeota archaeon]|nr:hypothetical protein [Nanoarchaeota archaeon]
INESGALLEDSSPSQEELPSETIKEFSNWCEETCELSNFNKSSYTLKIEISNAKLTIDKITYEIFGLIEIPEENITEIIPLPENVTAINVTITETNILTLQYKAIINKPTKWIKTIDIKDSNNTDISIELPKEARNISVKTGEEVQQALDELKEFDEAIEQTDRQNFLSGAITGNVALDIEQRRGIFTRLRGWLKNLTTTGNAIEEQELQNDITETIDKKIINLEEIISQIQTTKIAVEYYTEGPTAIEEKISNGKRVIISGDDKLNYTEVLAFAEIEEKFEVGQESRIKIYWREENKYINFTAHDLDNNGKLDYVEWIAPHLSDQTFDIIIEITKAEHLDGNREFVSDIYDEVYRLDDIWSEAISDGEYVRVTFEHSLDSSRDITIYPRIVSGNPRIEVYEINSDNKIAEFTNLQENQYNKIFLTNLVGEQDTFDLRVVEGSVEIDYIVDPITANPTTAYGLTLSLIDGMTWNHEFTCGDNMMLIVGIGVDSEPTATVSGITYNGTSMTLVGRQNCVTDDEEQAEMWSLTDPDCGVSLPIVVTFSNPTTEEAVGGSAVFYGVDSVNLSTMTTGYCELASCTTSSLTIPAQPGDVVVDVIAVDVDPLDSYGANQTILVQYDAGVDAIGMSYGNVTGNSLTMTWTWVGDEHATVGVALIPSPDVSWNQSTLDLGESINNITSVLEISSEKTNTNTVVSCSGDCTEITSNWTQRNMVDGQTDEVLITCSNVSQGVFNAVFNVTSDADS